MKIKLLSILAVAAILMATTPVALAANYEVELVVQSGNESKETDAILSFNADSFEVIPNKQSFKDSSKKINYTDIKVADYSYAKKPMLSGGGAVATALLVGVIFALPFLFIKKKKHWMTVQSESEFAVIKLKGNNYRAIRAEFETKGVTVNDVKEEEKPKDDK